MRTLHLLTAASFLIGCDVQHEAKAQGQRTSYAFDWNHLAGWQKDARTPFEKHRKSIEYACSLLGRNVATYSHERAECQCKGQNLQFGMYLNSGISAACQSTWIDPRLARFHLGSQTLMVFPSLGAGPDGGTSRIGTLEALRSSIEGIVPRLSPSLHESTGKDAPILLYAGAGELPDRSGMAGESTQRTLLQSLSLVPPPPESYGHQDAVMERTVFFEPMEIFLPQALGDDLESIPVHSSFFSLSRPEDLFDRLGVGGIGGHPKSFTKTQLALLQNDLPYLKKEQTLKNLERVHTAYEKYRTAREADFIEQQVRTRSALGCLDLCEFVSTLDVSEETPLQVSQRYVRGSRLFTHLTVRDRKTDDIIAVVILNFGGGISTVTLVQKVVSDDLTKSAAVFTTLDRNLKNLGLISDSVQIFDHAFNNSQAGVRAPKALLCESQSVSAHERLITGPFKAEVSKNDDGSPSFKGSLSGWFENDRGNLLKFLAGPADFLGDSEIPWRSSGDHGEHVRTQYLSEEPNGFFTEMDHGYCLDKYSDWKKPMREEGVRVVNFSGSQFSEANVCEEKYGKIVSDAAERKGFLWVLAAGNHGWHVRPGLTCPQAFTGKPNVVIVAAVDHENRLLEKSNAGRDWVDIAANGVVDRNNPESSGTSFAAPRVTAVAARLFNLFPEMTEAEVRIALLFGSRLIATSSWRGTSYTALPVRSGGVLDGEMSRQLLDIYDQVLRRNDVAEDQKQIVKRAMNAGKLPYNIAHSLFKRLYRNDEKQMNAKLDALKAGGLVF